MKNTIHMLKNTIGRQMNSFIITQVSGKLVVIDGGFREDAEPLIEYLRALTGSDKPRIEAWFLSHPHCDHVDAFLEIVEKHPESLEIGKVYYNFPSVQFLKPTRDDAWETADNFYRDLPLFADKICVVSAGDVFDFDEIRIEMLYSPNPELTVNVCNNSSLVFKMTLGGRTVMFTGDCGAQESVRILERYRESGILKCDICQMAHHGQGGAVKEFYEAVSPEICLWNTPLWLWNNDAGKGYNTHTFQTIEVRGWMEELGVKKNYVIKDGTQVCEL